MIVLDKLYQHLLMQTFQDELGKSTVEDYAEILDQSSLG